LEIDTGCGRHKDWQVQIKDFSLDGIDALPFLIDFSVVELIKRWKAVEEMQLRV